MLKKVKKLTTKLLMLTMCASLVSTSIVFSGSINIVYASASTVSAASNFTFDAKTGTIKRYNGSENTVVVPSTINGVRVKIIGYEAFRWCDSITSITIPNSVTSIGDVAFYGCYDLTNITIPNSVTSIGDSAFDECISLKSITIPGSVKSIGDKAFEGCISLRSIIIPNSVTSIGDRAFYECTSLENITVPNSVTSIGYCAFYLCSNLKSITIPNSVTSIGNFAFSNNNTLFYVDSEKAKEFLINYGVDKSKIILKAQPLIVKAISVTLNKPSLSVVKGYSSTLTASILPSNATNKGVTWKSSNPLVATVDSNGKVTGVIVGSATITATAKDGSGKYTSCKVTVTNPIKVTSIALNKTSLSVVKGYSSTLTASILPSNSTNKGVTWKSSNTAVATVDLNGKVTGIAAGTATITCIAKDGSGKLATCKVTVTNPIKVTSIALNKTSLSVVKGYSSTLTASILPSNSTNKGVTWKSSNTAVATVDLNGKVAGVIAGSATITATAKDGSGKYASCKVTVTNPIKITSIALNKPSLSVVKGYSSTLTASILPSNATNKGVTWKSSNPLVATVDSNGKVTGIGTGTATITCTTKDGSGKLAKCTITVTK